uniref:Uncharacterized protein n=1 Tax=Anguilla anguilla TaxID=7936 RepID=A0A0E9QLV6_ANGAN
MYKVLSLNKCTKSSATTSISKNRFWENSIRSMGIIGRERSGLVRSENMLR